MMQLYHATDQACIPSILKDGLKFKPSEYHWLGNGIYFYRDYQLAKWWATNPTKKFGVEINKPAIITICVEIPDGNILDLRNLSDYIDCVDAYKEFQVYAIQYLEKDIWHNRNKLRCSFFDWIFGTMEIDCIIGNFTLKNQGYLRSSPKEVLDQMKLFSLPFTETQICIRENKINKSDIKVLD